MAGGGSGEGWGAGSLDGNPPGVGHLLDDVVNVIGDGNKFSHGVAEPLNVGLKAVEGMEMV